MVVTIPKGSSGNDIIKILDKNKLMKSSTCAKIYLKMNQHDFKSNVIILNKKKWTIFPQKVIMAIHIIIYKTEEITLKVQASTEPKVWSTSVPRDYNRFVDYAKIIISHIK